VPRFRLIPHTSDIGLYAYGDTLEEEFSNAAYGMFSVMTDLRKIREIELRRFSVDSTDNEALLFDWLNQLL
jgi:SHS2 domain-containing protein